METDTSSTCRARRVEPHYCYFCGKAQQDVNRLVIGSQSGAAICDGCVHLMVQIIAPEMGVTFDAPNIVPYRQLARLLGEVAHLVETVIVLDGWAPSQQTAAQAACEDSAALSIQLASHVHEIMEAAQQISARLGPRSFADPDVPPTA